MKEFDVYISFTGKSEVKSSYPIVCGDFNTSRIHLEYDRDYSNEVIMFKMSNPNGETVMLEEVKNDVVVLVGYDENGKACSVLDKAGNYTIEVSVFKQDGKITSTPATLKVEKEQVKLENKVLVPYLPIIDDIVAEENKRQEAEKEREKQFEEAINNMPKPDLEYNPESENAQSGIAVAQALSGASGVKYITESVTAPELEDGIYIVDSSNGGSVFFASEKFGETFDYNELYDGVIIVSTDNTFSAKQIVVLSRDYTNYCPKIYMCYVFEDGTIDDSFADIIVSKTYVDEQVAPFKNINGIKVITEQVEAHTLEDGMYIIDGENGGEVQFACDEANDYGFTWLQSGFVFVSYDSRLGGKKISCFSTDEMYWYPILFTTTLDEDGYSIADTTDVYVSKKYVDEQIAEVKAMIDEASALIGGAE